MKRSFTVPGRPVPKTRMTRRGKWTKRARATLAYQKAVAWCAKAAHIPTFHGYVRLTAKIYLKNLGHRGDLSNYIKAIEDGLQYAGVLENDRQVIQYGEGTGIYQGEPERAEIALETLEAQ